MSHSEVAKFLRDPDQKAGREYILVDVRRVDFAVPNLSPTLANRLKEHKVHTAVNIPAQSFYPTRMTWLEVLGDIPVVIFYCSSSKGRGPRCAGWYQDVLDETGNTSSRAFVLDGGITLWKDAEMELTDSVQYFAP
jgi:rhodanese-related sulfurtransferase